ncbi:MAG: hypothetical protein F4184_06025 [Gemmatimonadetes bacterium]|nr:hypothetical protein [Gemmatimonadota bacterium]
MSETPQKILVRQWISRAENDLLNVRNNLAAQEIPWDTDRYSRIAPFSIGLIVGYFLVDVESFPSSGHPILHGRFTADRTG